MFFLLFLLFSSCGSENAGVVEVGNPTVEVKANTATKSLTESATALLGTFGGTETGFLLAETEAGSDFTCSFDDATHTMTCSCSGGGSVTQTFTESFQESENSVSFNNQFSMTYADCVMTSCSESVTVNGTATGSMQGSFQFESDEMDMTLSFQTESACSGMTVNAVSMGFDMQMTLTDGVENFSGTICLDGSTITFTSLEELSAAVDPDSSCEGGFGGD